jgi:hypothetical protein
MATPRGSKASGREPSEAKANKVVKNPRRATEDGSLSYGVKDHTAQRLVTND